MLANHEHAAEHPLASMTPASATGAAWQSLYSCDESALPTQSPAWFACIRAYHGTKDVTRIYHFADDVKAVLPLATDGFLSAASPPSGWGFGGVVADRALAPADVERIVDDLRRCLFLRVSLRPNPMAYSVWEAPMAAAGAIATDHIAHAISLEGGSADVLARMTSDARYGIRRAEKFGLKIEAGTSPRVVEAFCALYGRSIERWSRKSVLPRWLAAQRLRRFDRRARFEAMIAAMGENCVIWVAWHDGLPVSGILVLFGPNALYHKGAMDKGLANKTYANSLLQRLAIEEACRRGCRWYHMGETGRSADLARAKERFGAVRLAYREYLLESLPLSAFGSTARSVLRGLTRQGAAQA